MADHYLGVGEINWQWKSYPSEKMYVGETLELGYSDGSGDDRWGYYNKTNIPSLTWKTRKSPTANLGDKYVYWAEGTLTKPGFYEVTKAKLVVKYVLVSVKGERKKGGWFRFYVYGKYKHKIVFDKKGGAGGPIDETLNEDSYETSYTFNYTIPTNQPARNGYVFKGWSKSSSATTVDYQPGTSIQVVGSYTSTPSTTLYAVWEINKWYLKLNYNANGGSGAPSSYSTVTPRESGTTVTIKIPSTKPTRSGYAFKGWSMNKTATTASYQAGGTIQLAETLDSAYAYTLYAVWNKVYTSTLRYDANGGTGAPADDVLSKDSISQPADGVHTITDIIPTLDKYKFKGWSTVKYAIGEGRPNFIAGEKIVVAYYTTTTPIILYAVWQRKCSMYAKDNGVWKEGVLFAKVNGEWKEVEEAYAKDNGEWKQ